MTSSAFEEAAEQLDVVALQEAAEHGDVVRMGGRRRRGRRARPRNWVTFVASGPIPADQVGYVRGPIEVQFTSGDLEGKVAIQSANQPDVASDWGGDIDIIPAGRWANGPVSLTAKASRLTLVLLIALSLACTSAEACAEEYVEIAIAGAPPEAPADVFVLGCGIEDFGHFMPFFEYGVARIPTRYPPDGISYLLRTRHEACEVQVAAFVGGALVLGEPTTLSAGVEQATLAYPDAAARSWPLTAHGIADLGEVSPEAAFLARLALHGHSWVAAVEDGLVVPPEPLHDARTRTIRCPTPDDVARRRGAPVLLSENAVPSASVRKVSPRWVVLEVPRSAEAVPVWLDDERGATLFRGYAVRQGGKCELVPGQHRTLLDLEGYPPDGFQLYVVGCGGWEPVETLVLGWQSLPGMRPEGARTYWDTELPGSSECAVRTVISDGQRVGIGPAATIKPGQITILPVPSEAGPPDAAQLADPDLAAWARATLDDLDELR